MRTVDAATLAWVAYLDTDIKAAQRALRLPVADRGWPPGTRPPPPPPSEFTTIAEPPRPQTLVAPAGKSLRGGYARRAAQEAT